MPATVSSNATPKNNRSLAKLHDNKISKSKLFSNTTTFTGPTSPKIRNHTTTLEFPGQAQAKKKETATSYLDEIAKSVGNKR